MTSHKRQASEFCFLQRSNEEEWFGRYKWEKDVLYLEDDGECWTRIKLGGANVKSLVFTHLWFLAQDEENWAYVGRIDMMTKVTKLNLTTLDTQCIAVEVDQISMDHLPSSTNSEVGPTDWTIFTTSKEAFLLSPSPDCQIFRLLKDPDGLAILKNPINFPWPTRISEISTGNDFVVFRDYAGNLFSMGTGTRGELGVGLIRRVDEPVHIEELAGIPIKKVVCGGWHCLALAEGDDVYGWGWNRDGQLGEEKLTTEMFPTLLFDPADNADNAEPLPIDNVVAAMHSSTIIFANNAENLHFGKKKQHKSN